MNNFELMLQSTPYVFNVSSGGENPATIYLAATGQNALIVTSVLCYHDAAGAIDTQVGITDGVYTVTLYSGTQPRLIASAVKLFDTSVAGFCAYPLVLLPNTTNRKFLKVKYYSNGLNGEDEFLYIVATVYQLSGYVPK